MQNTIDEIKKREYISNFVAIKNIKRKLKTLLKDEEYLSMEKFIQHGTTNCILHSIAVTHYSLMKNALKRWKLNDIEKDVIKKHMFPLTLFLVPKYKESIIVCLVDKVCATYETFVKKEPYKRLRLVYKL